MGPADVAPNTDRMATMRLISLCPSLTELVFALDRGSDLVGITNFCIHPRGRVETLEKVRGTKNPNVERIIELQPDLVLLNEEENRIEDARALEAAGVPTLTTFPKTVADTAQMVRTISKALQSEPAGDRIAAEITRRMQAVSQAAAQDPRPTRFAYLIWRAPWMTVNADTYSSALLELAGGVNVFAERQPRYPRFEPEELAQLEPDRILLASEPFHFEQRHIDELAALTGLPARRCRLVDGEHLSWFGSRTPAGIDYARSLFAPDPSTSGAPP